jgi:hypothetical protein
LSSGNAPVDLNQLAASERYAVEIHTIEQVEELRSRLRREEAETEHKLAIERVEAAHRRRIFWAVFSVVVLAGVASMWIVLFESDVSPETEAWARTVASAIVAGLVGYFGGSAVKVPK